MKAVAHKRRRFGYRRIGVMLERKGIFTNHKKLYRLYTEEKLGVRRRRGRKRARGSRTPMPVALQPGERWSLDFLSDTFGVSRKFRILAVNDDCCRENLCLMADTSISGARVARELDALVRVYGKPASIVSDNVLYAELLAGLASGHYRIEVSRHVHSMAQFGFLVNDSLSHNKHRVRFCGSHRP